MEKKGLEVVRRNKNIRRGKEDGRIMLEVNAPRKELDAIFQARELHLEEKSPVS